MFISILLNENEILTKVKSVAKSQMRGLKKIKMRTRHTYTIIPTTVSGTISEFQRFSQYPANPHTFLATRVKRKER